MNKRRKMFTFRDEVLRYCLEYYGTEPDYPWDDEPEYAVLRNARNKKWYGLIMRISRDKLGFKDSAPVDILNIKCDPIALGSLLEKEGCHPAYHMSKSHWLTARLDGSVDFEEIKALINMSYELTAPRMKAAQKTKKSGGLGDNSAKK